MLVPEHLRTWLSATLGLRNNLLWSFSPQNLGVKTYFEKLVKLMKQYCRRARDLLNLVLIAAPCSEGARSHGHMLAHKHLRNPLLLRKILARRGLELVFSNHYTHTPRDAIERDKIEYVFEHLYTPGSEIWWANKSRREF